MRNWETLRRNRGVGRKDGRKKGGKIKWSTAVPVCRITAGEKHRRAAEGIYKRFAECREAFVAEIKRLGGGGGWETLNGDGGRVEKRKGEMKRE